MLSIPSSTLKESNSVPAAVSLNFPAIQPKITIGQESDPAEHEADAVAEKVGHMGKPPLVQRKGDTVGEEKMNHQTNISPLNPFIQSKALGSVTTVDTLGRQIQATKGHGSSLDMGTKSFMESRFATDFSPVNIHKDYYAAQFSEKLNAKAFTLGNDIYFNKGKYNPTSSTGRHLLAHELSHTLQQKGMARKIQREEKDKDPTYAPKPEIDFKLLMPEFQLKLYHFLLEADTGKVHLDYQTRNFMAGLSYQYGDALSLNMKFRDFKTKLGWTPGDNKFSLGINQGGFGAHFTTSPWKNQFGLGLTYGVQLPTTDQMNATFAAGGSSAAGMAMGIPGSFNDPIAYYQKHKDDIENISKTADMIKQITKAGESKIRFGGGISLTYDPVSQMVIAGKFGILF